MLKFLCGKLPDQYSFSFEQAIFNTPEHLRLQSKEGWSSFYAVNQSEHVVLGVIHFLLQHNLASSPFRASFGGLELSDRLTEKQTSDFVDFVVLSLRDAGVKTIVIKQCPFVGEDNRITNSFSKAGFEVQLSEVDSFINVSDKFTDHLQERKARKLRSLKKKNWTFEIRSQDYLSATYNFILKCRMRKGYSLSMTREQMEELVETFPDRILLFQVLEESTVIAAAICIKVKSNWLYDFYHDHDGAFDVNSPVLFLLEGIFNFCKVNSIKLLELGTSMRGTEINEGLLEFKQRLGAFTVPKITFVKKF